MPGRSKHEPLDHAAARRYAYVAMAAAALFLGVTVVFAMVWAPGAATPTPVAFNNALQSSGETAPEPEPQDPFEFDAAGFTERIGLTKNAPKKPKEPEIKIPDGPDNGSGPRKPITQEPPPPAPSALADVRYLGSLRDPRSARALIAVDGRQRIVPIGGDVNGYTLDEVGDDAIRLSSDGQSEEIGKAAPNRSPLAGMGSPSQLVPEQNAELEPFERPSGEDFRNMTREERQEYRNQQMERLRLQRERNGLTDRNRRGDDLR